MRLPANPGCWVWTGAISGKGHGRLQIADDNRSVGPSPPARKTFVVIAHRFGFALRYGVDALLDVPIVSHRCDNPLCQRPNAGDSQTIQATGRNTRAWFGVGVDGSSGYFRFGCHFLLGGCNIGSEAAICRSN